MIDQGETIEKEADRTGLAYVQLHDSHLTNKLWKCCLLWYPEHCWEPSLVCFVRLEEREVTEVEQVLIKHRSYHSVHLQKARAPLCNGDGDEHMELRSHVHSKQTT